MIFNNIPRIKNISIGKLKRNPKFTVYEYNDDYWAILPDINSQTVPNSLSYTYNGYTFSFSSIQDNYQWGNIKNVFKHPYDGRLWLSGRGNTRQYLTVMLPESKLVDRFLIYGTPLDSNIIRRAYENGIIQGYNGSSWEDIYALAAPPLATVQPNIIDIIIDNPKPYIGYRLNLKSIAQTNGNHYVRVQQF